MSTANTFSVIVLSMFISAATHAENSDLPLIPSPSVLDFTDGEGWGFALGATAEYGTAYDGSDEQESELEPAAAIQWRSGENLFFFEGIELGWRRRMADQWLVQLGARYEGDRDESDSDDNRLDGLDDVDDEIVGALEVRRAFGKDWRSWVAARTQIGDGDFGVLGVLAAGYRFGQALDGTGTEVFIFSTFGDSDFLNRDFGITESESISSGLAATDLSGGYRSTGVNIVDRRNIGKNFHIISQAGIEFYGSDVQDSPIAREDYEFEVGLTVLYRF